MRSFFPPAVTLVSKLAQAKRPMDRTVQSAIGEIRNKGANARLRTFEFLRSLPPPGSASTVDPSQQTKTIDVFLESLWDLARSALFYTMLCYTILLYHRSGAEEASEESLSRI